MIITAVPPSDEQSVTITLQDDGMEVDPRVIEFDYFGYRFKCTIDGRILTIQRLDTIEGGWKETLFFRTYNSKTEHVPSFALNGTYRYFGIDGERAPCDISEGIVDESVEMIQHEAFCNCRLMKKCTMMGDRVKDIEEDAFMKCSSMTSIRLSKSLEYIGPNAFDKCFSLDALFLPSSVQTIAEEAFAGCQNLRVLTLPDDMELENVGDNVAQHCDALFNHDGDNMNADGEHTKEELMQRMDNLPLIKLCSSASVTTSMVRDKLERHGGIVTHHRDHHNLAPLHVLAMNPHTRENNSDDKGGNGYDATLQNCFVANPYALLCHDDNRKTPLDYLWENSHVDGIVHAIRALCMHRDSHAGIRNNRKRMRMEL